jgi:RimJ/RimL family protein N-acetyltransferase
VSSAIPEIETERLRLRALREGDVADWAGLLYADPEVMRFLLGDWSDPVARAERYLRYFLEHWPRHGYGEWAVTDKASGAFMGQCGLNYVANLGQTEIDFALARLYWGRGFASEAARAAARFAFDTANLSGLIGFVVPENGASRRVLAHLGFVEERVVQQWGADLLLHTLTPQQFHAADAPRLAADAS